MCFLPAPVPLSIFVISLFGVGRHTDRLTNNWLSLIKYLSLTLLIISLGLTVKSTDKSQKAICNMALTEGIYYWEIICPKNLSGMRKLPLKINNCLIVFGVTTKGDNPLTFTQFFHSTTERVVGVELNLNTLELRYFIQSRYVKKNKCIKLILKEKQPNEKACENLEWYPLIEFKESGNVAILNPFRQRPVPESTSAQALTKLPEKLYFDITHSKVALLQQIIGNKLVVYHTFAETEKFDLKADLAKLQNLP